ncbi:MAG: NADH-quinone oxidoreductase subunit NuoF [Planctomycetota bacterium]
MQTITSREELIRLRESVISKIDTSKPTITLCGGTGCSAFGSQKVYDAFEAEIKRLRLEDKVTLKRTGCHGFCERGPILVILPQEIFYQKVKPSDVPDIIRKTIIKNEVVRQLLYVDPRTGERIVKESEVPFYKHQMRLVFRHNGKIDPISFDDYIRYDGFQALLKILYEMTPPQVVDEIKKSGVRGRGGAGFPTGLKWEFARKSPETKRYVICNGDEGDPGAFMDRSVMEGDPFAVIEGLMIAGYAIGAKKGYIYVRAEYPLAVKNLTIAIETLKKMSLLGKNILGREFDFDVIIKQGAGAFVCGEETALIASIEGKRGMPKPRPPFPAESGLWGKPTVINNVETLANLPLIIIKGAEWYASIGTKDSKGTKIFALAGKINNTGLVEVPIGTSLRKIIEDIGGGIPKGRTFKAVQMGGPSGGCVPAEYLDLPVDYESLKSVGAIMGSGGMIVMDNTTCMVDIARYFLDFCQKESCGKCVPCRIGTKRMLEIATRFTKGEAQAGDIEKLKALAESVRDSSLCGLGQTAPNPVLSTLRYFSNEYEAHLAERYCPSSACEVLVKSPCQNACPAHINVPQYNELVRQKEYLRAVNLIRRSVPLPSSLGRVCFRPCESVCRRGEIDTSIAINHIKRYITENSKSEIRNPKSQLFPFNAPEIFNPRKKDKKVAIIGAGPAGLSAAYFLRIMGREVTVFEKNKSAGGLLANGIPAYRLPKKVVQDEINLLKAMGIAIKANSPISARKQWDVLRNQFDAIFIAVGATKSKTLGVPGENIKGVVDALQFLDNMINGRIKKVPQKVTVIGGGNSAIDSARSALRLGAKEVTVIYRRSLDEMPAHKEEIQDAMQEGVKFRFLAAPAQVTCNKGSNWLRCQEMTLGPADKSGRRKPVPKAGSDFTVEAGLVITAISQTPDLEFAQPDIELTPWGGIKVNPLTMETSQKGVFAGGDTITNAGMVIYAIATGQKAAVAIDRYLGGAGKLPENIDPLLTYSTDLKGPHDPLKDDRQAIQHIPLKKRAGNFKEVICGYSDSAAYNEASRCLRCDLENKEYGK